jgi:RNA polymerase sigma-70 factor (ECF subfamily)
MTDAETIYARPATACAPAAKAAHACSPDYGRARRVARGDMEALDEIYRLHHRRVNSLCMSMTMNAAEAEDLTQEVFILVLRKAGGYRGEASFTTWLHRMTVNHVLMHFRGKKVRKEGHAEDEQDDARRADRVPAACPPPLIDRITLDRALAQLPPGRRAAFVLHDIEGHRHEEVARILGYSTGTSKSQLSKARTQLRRILKGRS